MARMTGTALVVLTLVGLAACSKERRAADQSARKSAGATAGAPTHSHVTMQQPAFDGDAAAPDSPLASFEEYAPIIETGFHAAAALPFSTFSIDVDTASYANVRRFLEHGRLPPPDAVRIEELINYFDYGYPPPSGDVPFAVHVEMVDCPWQAGHVLARIGLKGREIADEARTASNLVFLLDVSGSMSDANKLPLVKSAMKLLLERLGENDRVAIVVYAGASGLVLPSTPSDRRHEILAALDELHAGGSTNGGEGIQLAYETAVANFINGGTNRVILCTDGDFNMGVTSRSELVRLIERQAHSGVFLSVLGFGAGNLKDATLEQLADRGNGQYAYVDSLSEARKVLVEGLSGTLVTIAKDVKIQLRFNPARVASYRLIGYENRRLRTEDFRDDAKDAGEIGAGHTVTALYELVPAVSEVSVTERAPAATGVEPGGDTINGRELFTVFLRYKLPADHESSEFHMPVMPADRRIEEASPDFRFASAVAAFGLLLRDSAYQGDATYEMVLELARTAEGRDRHGYRAAFLQLVEQAREYTSPRRPQ